MIMRGAFIRDSPFHRSRSMIFAACKSHIMYRDGVGCKPSNWKASRFVFRLESGSILASKRCMHPGWRGEARYIQTDLL
jgi:hypothetical protein